MDSSVGEDNFAGEDNSIKVDNLLAFIQDSLAWAAEGSLEFVSLGQGNPALEGILAAVKDNWGFISQALGQLLGLQPWQELQPLLGLQSYLELAIVHWQHLRQVLNLLWVCTLIQLKFAQQLILDN